MLALGTVLLILLTEIAKINNFHKVAMVGRIITIIYSIAFIILAVALPDRYLDLIGNHYVHKGIALCIETCLYSVVMILFVELKKPKE